MHQDQKVDLTLLSHSFPVLTEPQVDRSNFLDTIDSMFDSGVVCVVIEGPDGFGKTTLAAQYASRHRYNTFSLFIRGSNRWGYDIDVLREDLCAQLHWAITGRATAENIHGDDALLRDRLLDLRKLVHRTRTRYKFVVDGLDSIPPQEKTQKQLIFDMLPFDFPYCQFLFSNGAAEPLEIPPRIRSKSYPLAAFNSDETRKYLSGAVNDAKVATELHALSKGIPEHLASIRRSIRAGHDPAEILRLATQHMQPIFEAEWQQVDLADDTLAMFLGILAFDQGTHLASDLATTLNVNVETVLSKAKSLSFLSLDQDRNEITFSSDTFRNFAVTKLGRFKKAVQDRQIEQLLAKPMDERAVQILPEKLRDAERYADLVEYLSPDLLVQVLERAQSFGPVRRNVEIGLHAAEKLNRDPDFIRFSMQQSALAERFSYELYGAEIEARMALGDDKAAIAIANTAPMKEDRLHLLATIAKAKRLQGLTPAGEVLDQIRALYAQIDRVSLGERTGSLAADLIFADPDLAIQLMDESVSDERRTDDTFSTLSLGTSVAEVKQRAETDGLESFRSGVSDPRLQVFLSAAALFMGALDADTVLADVERLSSTGAKIFFLRQWAIRNRRRQDAHKVVAHALKLAIQTTEYTPNARDIRQIAAPLPFIADKESLANLIRSFDAQKGGVEKYGPTVDYVRFQLLLAEAEYLIDRAAAKARILETYYYSMGQVQDLSVRLECLARLIATLERVDADGAIERDEQIQAVAVAEFRATSKELLESTADHLSVAKGALQALAGEGIDLAKELARSLNTEKRRDLGWTVIIEAAIPLHQAEANLTDIPSLIGEIQDSRLRADAIGKVWRRLADNLYLVKSIDPLRPLVGLMGDIELPEDRCIASACAVNVLLTCDPIEGKALSKGILDSLEDLWSRIDAAWDKISSAFEIATRLSKTAADVSLGFLKGGSLRETGSASPSPRYDI